MSRRHDNGEVTWRELDRRHREALARKYDKIGMLKAMIEEWEQTEDHDHLRDLRARLRSAECQLKSMKP